MSNFINFKTKLDKEMEEMGLPFINLVDSKEGEFTKVENTGVNRVDFFINKEGEFSYYKDEGFVSEEEFLKMLLSKLKARFRMDFRKATSCNWEENTDYELQVVQKLNNYNNIGLTILDSLANLHETCIERLSTMENDRLVNKWIGRDIEEFTYVKITGCEIGNYKSEVWDREYLEGLINKDEESKTNLIAKIKRTEEEIRDFIKEMTEYTSLNATDYESLIKGKESYATKVEEVTEKYDNTYIKQYVDIVNNDNFIKESIDKITNFDFKSYTW